MIASARTRVLSAWLIAAMSAGCARDPMPNCWDTRYPFEVVPVPRETEPYLFACRAKGAALGIAVRFDGTVVALEKGVEADGTESEWHARPVAAGGGLGLSSTELEKARRALETLPAMPWPWDRTLQDELDCFGRTAPGPDRVVPLSAGARPTRAGQREIVVWLERLRSRFPEESEGGTRARSGN
jgi:hypothetical protein